MPASYATLEVKVLPNAPRNELAGRAGNVVKIRIHAPALEGRANEELCGFLADLLQVHRRDITLVRGDKSRLKVLRVSGMTDTDLQGRLGNAGA
ncbi:MAG: DUF167 domain-containing protein [Opitutaceae bacterium]|nr:DUF167 domain-containing protein [Opitutaceae bacterium]